MKRIGFIGGLLLLLLTACFKEDDQLELSILTTGVDDVYTLQTWFDLGSGQEMHKAPYTAWDLAFAADESGWQVRLNSAKNMRVGNAGSVSFQSVGDATGLEMRFDDSDGDADSTAIRSWFQIEEGDTLYSNAVFVVDLGIDLNLNALGYRKMQLQKVDADGYHIRYARMDGSDESEVVILKNPDYNFINFSFENGSVVQKEPPKTDWDLLFTQYTTMLYDGNEPYPYLLRGVLINPFRVSVAVDKELKFEQIEQADVQQLQYSNAWDAIGYDWKYYDFDQQTYTVNTSVNYIIRDHSGSYYKLRFVAYINSQGERGYPVFEFSRI